MLHRLVRHFGALLRAESAITDARLRLLVRRFVLLGFAGLIAVFGLCMLNAAAFLALEALWGPIWAAVAAALADFAFAVAIAGIALALRSSSRLDTATELRQTAMDGLENELSDLSWLSRRTMMTPLDVAVPAMILPLITVIIRGLRKKKPDQP